MIEDINNSPLPTRGEKSLEDCKWNTERYLTKRKNPPLEIFKRQTAALPWGVHHDLFGKSSGTTYLVKAVQASPSNPPLCDFFVGFVVQQKNRLLGNKDPAFWNSARLIRLAGRVTTAGVEP